MTKPKSPRSVNEPYTNIMKKTPSEHTRFPTLSYRKSVKEHSDYLSNPMQKYKEYTKHTNDKAKY